MTNIYIYDSFYLWILLGSNSSHNRSSGAQTLYSPPPSRPIFATPRTLGVPVCRKPTRNGVPISKTLTLRNSLSMELSFGFAESLTMLHVLRLLHDSWHNSSAVLQSALFSFCHLPAGHHVTQSLTKSSASDSISDCFLAIRQADKETHKMSSEEAFAVCPAWSHHSTSLILLTGRKRLVE